MLKKRRRKKNARDKRLRDLLKKRRLRLRNAKDRRQKPRDLLLQKLPA